MPSASAVLAARFLSGRKSTASPWLRAQASMVLALAEVHTLPPCRPQTAFTAAEEFT
jgi:hypothetical protein